LQYVSLSRLTNAEEHQIVRQESLTYMKLARIREKTMSQNKGLVEGFVANVRSRLNRHRMWTTLVWTIAAAAGVLVACGLWYTLRGYAVPGSAISATIVLAAIGGVAAWRVRLFSADGAAQICDRFYRLHDAISSYLHFSRSGRSGGYYTLQAQQTRARVEPLDPQAIKYEPPRRGIMLAACLLAIAIPLSLRGPSDAVLQQQQLETQTIEATAVINEALAKQVDELQKESPDPNEKELLNPNKLREWVNELKESTDHKEALRQYAQLERKLNEARLAVQNKRDEQLLERAARELENSRETQPLSDELKQKNFDKAAEQLDKMAPQQSSEPLDKQRKELARLKAAAQHMAAAARASKSSAQSAKSAASASESKSQSASSKAGAGASSQSSSGVSGSASEGSEMSQIMEDLADAVANLDKSLEDAERQEAREGQCDAKKKGECEACKKSVASQIAKLCNGMKKLGMCKKCDAKLCKLCSMCSQCQGGLCNAAAMCMSPKAGGKYAGSGTSTNRRSERDELVDNGQTTQLKGIKGAGPSLTTIESAEQGSGTSARKGSARERTFQRQYESFVAREDVPEQVKLGVKHYFEVIHQLKPESASGATNASSGN
jgi:hypothetical protein